MYKVVTWLSVYINDGQGCDKVVTTWFSNDKLVTTLAFLYGMSVMFLFAATLPPSKRMKYAQVDGAKPAIWKPSPSDAIKPGNKKEFNAIHEVVPVYYHWFAVILHDALLINSETPSDFSSPPEVRVNTLVKQLNYIKQNQLRENEYKCSSVLHLAMQQFFFTYEDREKAACLAQFPIQGTRRLDYSVHTLREYFPVRDILFSDYKPTKLEEAVTGSVCYFMNANEDKFTWAYGLPCTSTQMSFQLYISANRKALVINLATVSIEATNADLEKFLRILYGAVHWRIDNPGLCSTQPLTCEPIQGLELRDNFGSHLSNRVFFNAEKKTVYKIYEVGNHKKPNFNLMLKLNYFENLKLQDIGVTHHLLSYTILRGVMEPNNIEQIKDAKRLIAKLHQEKLVHADIRIGNIVFLPLGNKAFLIDFDFTESVGSEYHDDYNRNLEERHPDIRSRETNKKEFCHDEYALNYIAWKFFEASVYP